jgi:hypothetical protein
MHYLNLTKYVLGHILRDFSHKISGHPVLEQVSSDSRYFATHRGNSFFTFSLNVFLQMCSQKYIGT